MTGAPEADRLWAEAVECHRRGDGPGAILGLCRTILARRGDAQALRALCSLLQRYPEAFAESSPPRAAGGPELVSVVTCSIDPRKLDGARASWARAFGSAPWELVAIPDARSLAEGYGRGVARARGDVIVFAHDDIEVLSRDAAGAFVRALDRVDVVGLVGTTKLLGPAHAWGGTAFSRGRIAQRPSSGNGVDLVVCNLAPDVTPGLEAIDGVLMAARRKTVEAVGFDAATFDGFHLYDLDFSYRAHLAGLRVGVTSEVVLRHDSEGSFDGNWLAHADRFRAKFPQVAGARAENAVALVPFADADALMAFCARLDEASRRALAA